MKSRRNSDIDNKKLKNNLSNSMVAKATIGLMIVTMLSKVLGFFREMVLAASYGATAYSDAYLIALNIPNVIFVAIGTAISTTFIPMYCEINSKEGKKASIKFTNNIINIVGLLSIIISIVCLIFMEPIVKVFAMGFEGERFRITVEFTKVLVLSLVFISTSEIIKSFLNANDNFTISGIMMGIPSNIIIILAIIISTKTSPYALAIGTLIGIASKFIFQLPYAYRFGYKYKAIIDTKDKYIKKTIYLLGPVLIGVAVNQVNAMIDRTLASTLAPGVVSALNYANRLNEFVLGLFIASISVVIFPLLSKLSMEDNRHNFVECITKSINSVILLILPVSVGAIVLARPIVSILFQRGAFDQTATDMTAIALMCYSVGLIAFSLREIIGKIFYSLKDTKTPMRNAVISMLLNIVLNIILVKYMGYAGLAIATSISAIICVVLLFISLINKIGYFGQDKIIIITGKSLLASIIMGIIAFKSYKLIGIALGIGFISKIISLFASVVIGAIVYGILIIVLKVEEVNFMIDVVKTKILSSRKG